MWALEDGEVVIGYRPVLAPEPLGGPPAKDDCAHVREEVQQLLQERSGVGDVA